MAKHPGLDLFNKISGAHEDPNAIRSYLGEQISAVTRRLDAQKPLSRDPENIQHLKTLEVAFCAAQWTDLKNPTAARAIAAAIDGKTPTGASLRSRLYEMEALKAAEVEDVTERFAVRVNHMDLR